MRLKFFQVEVTAVCLYFREDLIKTDYWFASVLIGIFSAQQSKELSNFLFMLVAKVCY